MGAACSVKEYEEITLRYLARMRDYGTELYHVVLHPEAERLEVNAWDLFPRGSLLVYIDNYLTTPSTPRDRTVGRFENLMHALPETPANVRGHLDVKVLSAGSETEGRRAVEADLELNAEEHSAFTRLDFWKQEFYMVSPDNVNEDAKRESKAGNGVIP